jgi:hypothetical protein
MVTSGLAPSRGAVITNDFSGGLRGLRPPATFLQPFGLRLLEVFCGLPLNPITHDHES